MLLKLMALLASYELGKSKIEIVEFLDKLRDAIIEMRSKE